MILLTPALRSALRANAVSHHAAARADQPEPDPVPALKLFNPIGPANLRHGSGQAWLATELYDDGDTLFGLADLGFGCPKLGVFSLSEIASFRLGVGLGIERDEHFASDRPLSAWAEPSKVPAMRSIVGKTAEGAAARATGSILTADQMLRRTPQSSGIELPPRGG